MQQHANECTCISLLRVDRPKCQRLKEHSPNQYRLLHHVSNRPRMPMIRSMFSSQDCALFIGSLNTLQSNCQCCRYPCECVGHLVCKARACSKLDHCGAALGDVDKVRAWSDGALEDRGGWVTERQGALAACTSWDPPGKPARRGPGIRASLAAQLLT